MLVFEALFRYGSVGILFAIAILILRDGRQLLALRIGLLLIASIISLFLTTGSEEISIGGQPAAALRMFDMLNSIFVWWLGLALFDDDFQIGVREWTVLALYLCVGIPSRLHHVGIEFYWHEWLDAVAVSMVLAMMAHLAYQAVVGRKEDLLENRRRVRIRFAIAVALLVFVSIVAEEIAARQPTPVFDTILITYVATFPLGIWAILWLTRLHPELLAFETGSTRQVRESEMSSWEQQVYQRLITIVDKEQAYRDHTLSIGNLAERVAIPPHQLRKLINQTMGYRNFSAFVNHYRIREVKQMLANPEKSNVPILTLALEAGFSSLAPFQRAFKASEGLTPTEYRNTHSQDGN
ncbi:MAG: helix-turn-helix domain-containing protein [Pseudomonadota bacterium]